MKDETLLFRIKFGLRIKELRIERNIDQNVLSALLNKDKQSISRYENDGANPRADIVLEIAKALELKSVDELFNFSTINDDEVNKIISKIRKKDNKN